MTLIKKLKQRRDILEKRISALKKSFDFKQGEYGPTKRQLDKLKGFVLLCHAEIEDYFESVATMLIENSYKTWREKHRSDYILTCFLLRYNKLDKNLTVDSAIFELKKDYLKNISNNHGIRPSHVHGLFYPLGYDDKDFSVTLISELDSLGSSRGEIAHIASYKATGIMDKETIYKKIDAIIKELEDFESAIIHNIK